MESKRYATCPTCGHRTTTAAKPLKRDLSLLAVQRALAIFAKAPASYVDAIIDEILHEEETIHDKI